MMTSFENACWLSMFEDTKWVEGYDGLYAVSRCGRVYSLVHNKNRRRRELEQSACGRNRYLSVQLSKGGVKKRYSVHRLVAIAFIPNPHNYPCVNHMDGDRMNNDADNLEWVTHSQNSKHAVSIGHSRWGNYSILGD